MHTKYTNAPYWLNVELFHVEACGTYIKHPLDFKGWKTGKSLNIGLASNVLLHEVMKGRLVKLTSVLLFVCLPVYVGCGTPSWTEMYTSIIGVAGPSKWVVRPFRCSRGRDPLMDISGAQCYLVWTGQHVFNANTGH